MQRWHLNVCFIMCGNFYFGYNQNDDWLFFVYATLGWIRAPAFTCFNVLFVYVTLALEYVFLCVVTIILDIIKMMIDYFLCTQRWDGFVHLFVHAWMFFFMIHWLERSLDRVWMFLMYGNFIVGINWIQYQKDHAYTGLNDL